MITVFTDDKGAYRYVPKEKTLACPSREALRQVGLRLPL